jgi:hypothetical protein
VYIGGGGASGLQPHRNVLENLKIILNVCYIYFNGALCLFRIRVQRQIVLGHSANEI